MVKSWQSSGKALSEFADRHGVDPKRIARWASRQGPPVPSLGGHLKTGHLSTLQNRPLRLGGREYRSGSAISSSLMPARSSRSTSPAPLSAQCPAERRTGSDGGSRAPYAMLLPPAENHGL